MAIGAAFLISGCAIDYHAPVKAPSGILFNSYKQPLTTDFHYTPTGPATKRTSHATTKYFQDIILTGINVAWDDAEIASIARSGGIEEVAYAELEVLNILGVYAEYKVVIHGN